jgi:hypothetical protein
MAEETELSPKEEAEFTRGFNNGYVIGKYDPELAKELQGSIKLDSQLASGLYHGLNQYALEQERERIKQLDELRKRSKDKDRNR